MRTQRDGEYFAAVYWIIRDDEWKILMQRRANTWYNDGLLQLPSWHIEWAETYRQALKREMKEEIWIEIEDKDIILKHVLHRICTWDRVYYDIFLEINSYHWKIQNCELDKCSELDFFDIQHPDFTEYNKAVLENIDKWVQISEIIS